MAKEENGEYYDERQRTNGKQRFLHNVVEHQNRIRDSCNQSRQPVVDVDRAQKESWFAGKGCIANGAFVGNPEQPGKERSFATDGTAEQESAADKFEKTSHARIVGGGAIRASGVMPVRQGCCRKRRGVR